jgi:hypothetical protein
MSFGIPRAVRQVRLNESRTTMEADTDPGQGIETAGERPGLPARFRNRRDLLIYAYLRIRQTRRYWLLPVLGLVALIGLFLNLFTGHNVLPAIYSLIP